MIRFLGCLLVAVVIAAWSCAPGLAAAERRTTEIVVDLAVDGGPAAQRGSGILHSLGLRQPPDDLVAPLKLKCFRGQANRDFLLSPGFPARLKALGVEHVQLVVPEEFMQYRYPADIPWPGDNGDWKPWEQFLGGLVQRCRAADLKVEWDIWNEPTFDCFWRRDRERFNEMWRRTVLNLRAIEPGAVIVGPSIARAPGLCSFNAEYLEAFLLYAKANNVLPDILSWHELVDGHGRFIPDHVAQMRRFMEANHIPIRRISINEIIPQNKQFSPGVAVSYLAGLEAAGVESAAHSCWPDVVGNNGGNCSLDGMLTHDTGRPRSSWWAYKAYADLTSRQVPATRVTELPNGTVFGPWRAIGPFHQPGQSGFDAVFPPEQELDLARSYGNLKWTERPQLKDGIPHNLAGIFKPADGDVAGYLHRTVTMQQAASVPVSISGDDSIKLWVNGRQILALKKEKEGDCWAYTNPQATVELPLRKGRNDLLMKIDNKYAFYAFFFAPCRIRGVDALAAFDPARRTANIIMGNTDDQETDVRLTVRNLDRADGLVRGGRVRLVAARIPNTQTAPLEKPELVRDEPLPVIGNQLQVLLPGLGPEGVYTVQLERTLPSP